MGLGVRGRSWLDERRCGRCILGFIGLARAGKLNSFWMVVIIGIRGVRKLRNLGCVKYCG